MLLLAVALGVFVPSPPFPLDVSADFSTEVLSVLVPGGATILVGITAQAHLLVMSLTDIVVLPDFHSTKQGLPLVNSWSHGLD